MDTVKKSVNEKVDEIADSVKKDANLNSEEKTDTNTQNNQ